MPGPERFHEYQTWDYDAAGNRTYDSAKTDGSWTYDNLNRMTNSPKLGTGGGDFTGWVYQNDILGNRTGRNLQAWSNAPARYDWDCLNRALLIANSSAGSTYVYRADGQRVEKVDGVTIAWTGSKRSGHYDTNTTQNGPTSRYFYDGQMGMEDDYNPSGSITTINRYGLGGRGIDRIENYASSTTTYGYPLYDGHGNMRAVLAKSGSSYTTGNWRSYDVWGSLRSGGSSTDPKQGYCANLGHVADSESGLIYMRARYMEPSSGRFISEDPAMHGINWFRYCSNDPVNRSDPSGMIDITEFLELFLKLLDRASTGEDLTKLFTGGSGLDTLGASLLTAPSASEVEAAWHEFIKAWEYSLLGYIDDSGNLSLLCDLTGYVMSVAEDNPIGVLLGGSLKGVQLAILSIGYQMRILWYTNDIDGGSSGASW